MVVELVLVYDTDLNTCEIKAKPGFTNYQLGVQYLSRVDFYEQVEVPAVQEKRIKDMTLSDFEKIIEFHKEKYAKSEFFWQAIRKELFG